LGVGCVRSSYLQLGITPATPLAAASFFSDNPGADIFRDKLGLYSFDLGQMTPENCYNIILIGQGAKPLALEHLFFILPGEHFRPAQQ
jgi:hypothetical protein